jgi:hypothetical protein
MTALSPFMKSIHFEQADGVENGVDFDAVYRTERKDVAWQLIGWEIEVDETTKWSGFEARTGRVVAVMVGDDKRFVFEPTELVRITEDSYCHSCGQIGCRHGNV